MYLSQFSFIQANDFILALQIESKIGYFVQQNLRKKYIQETKGIKDVYTHTHTYVNAKDAYILYINIVLH